MAFQVHANRITPSLEYQLEVYMNKNKELELHTQALEKRVEKMQDN